MGMRAKSERVRAVTATRMDSPDMTDFDLTEDKTDSKFVITIFGGKGVGKTTIALKFDGSHAVLSLDRKSRRVADQTHNIGRDIRVFDARRYFVYDKENFTRSSSVSIAYFHAILDSLDADPDNRPDWITFDALEYLVMMCEGKMRHDNNLGPFEPFGKNPALWRERNTNLRMLHDHAMRVAQRGVIYTAYYGFDSGENSEYKVPKWTDVVQSESDIVIHARMKVVTENDTSTVSHYADIQTSKIENLLPTGETYDMHENVFERTVSEYYREVRGGNNGNHN